MLPGSEKKLNKLKNLYLFYFIFLWISSVLTALDPQKAITQYKLDIWTVERGFPQNSVLAIVQTHDGYIWTGTFDGLVRFDGVRFKVFNKNNTKQLKSNVIRALCEDRNGNLWIGTDEGLSCLKSKDGKFTTYSPEEERTLNEISSIIEDQDGTLWIGTFNSGVTCLKNDKFTTYTTRDGLASNVVCSLHEDKQGNLWIGTRAGITIRTPSGRFISVIEQVGLSSSYILSFCEKASGELWIGTTKGLYRIKDQTFTHYGINDGLPNPKIVSLYEDSDQNFWLGTDGSGLVRMKGGKFHTFSLNDGMACGFVYPICEDREGSLWLGTLEGGLHRLSDTKFTTYTAKEGLAHDHVNCIYEDRGGNIWIGTDGGVNWLKDGELTLEYTTRKGLLSNIVHSILEDREGGVWIGTEEGLHRFKGGILSTFTTKNGLSHNTIFYLLEDKQGAIWIGTTNGLNQFHKGKFSIFTKKEGLLDNTVTYIYEDRAGNLWIVITRKGLNRLKDGKCTAYTTKEGLVNNDVECVYEDEEGVLYIGTRGGLSLRVKEKFTNVTTQSGLIDNHVNYILKDDMGNLWLAGRTGISQVSKKELMDFDMGKIDKIHPVTYNERDGMKSRWCKNSGEKTRDGRLWFATDKGVVMIDPAKIERNTLPPSVIIEELIVDGEQVDLSGPHSQKGEPLVIPPGKKRLEFYYTGLSFVKPRQMRFKLKLEGYDRDWVDAGNARSNIYTGLSPGKYIFKVIACNSDGVWNQTGASFSFYIKPYFYQTLWFYIFVTLIVLLTVFSGFRFRVRQLKSRERKLTELVGLRTKELNEQTLELEKAHIKLQMSKQIIEEKNRNILASIQYARKIQQAILPTDDRMRRVLKDYFVIYKPRDIVSGDFYWFTQSGDTLFIAAVDCTGHGVPGAFLSLIGNMELNEIVNEKFVSDPAQFLLYMDLGIRRTLQQEKGENRSDEGMGVGMEVGLCMIDLRKGRLTFAGARRPLYYIKNSEFFEIKGDRKSIGGRQKEENPAFTNHKIDIQSETIIYLTTDGFADQNNWKNKKYGSLRLKRFLQANTHLSMGRQKEALLEELNAHQGTEEQRDDITIIGIKLKVKSG
jgi:ligand-binding sensor domain-containing protein/serine phosphatase RsbU (regulator of sigma subunit)